jgi:hypothetical protein
MANKYLGAEGLQVVVSGDAEKIRAELSRIAPVRVFNSDGSEKPRPAA